MIRAPLVLKYLLMVEVNAIKDLGKGEYLNTYGS